MSNSSGLATVDSGAGNPLNTLLDRRTIQSDYSAVELAWRWMGLIQPQQLLFHRFDSLFEPGCVGSVGQ